MKMIFLDDNDSKQVAHYSPAVVHNNIIYVSGQLPIRKGETQPSSDKIEDQTLLVLEKLQEILHAANSNINQVLRTTIYVPNVSYWNQVNAVYAKFFKGHRPARTVVPSRELHFGCLIELEAIAYIDE
ncbi:MAG: RidA family protein [Candidatus Heimdallarchaeota archaeon]